MSEIMRGVLNMPPSLWRDDPIDQAQRHAIYKEAWRQIERLAAIVDPLNRLREDEGNSVTFICPNPDFNGEPDEAIEVSAEWTNWEPRRFTGQSLAECLKAAEKAREQ